MKKITFMIFVLLSAAASSPALTLSFSDQDFLSGASWGTMEILQDSLDDKKIFIKYTASSLIPSGSEVTGFVFATASDTDPVSVSNPSNSDFSGDMDTLTWLLVANPNGIPQPANRNEFSPQLDKDMFDFGVSEGSGQFTPPGITAGGWDVFYMSFANKFDVSSIIYAGIRLQSLPNNINGGSLLLVGKEVTPPAVPEPATMLLFGTGIVGLAGIARRKRD